VRTIKPVENRNQEDIVEQLEWFLERAKKGALLAIAIASIDTDNQRSDSFASTGYRFELLGALELIKRNILRTFE
jgi:hypothetical protein